MVERTPLTEGVTTLSDDWVAEHLLADPANERGTSVLIVRVDLVVFLSVISIMAHEFELLALLLSLKFLVELPTGLVVRAIMDEDATVSKVAAASLVPVFAALWVVVNTRCVSDEGRRAHRAQGARELLVPEVLFRLLEIVLVAMQTAIDAWIEFAFLDTFANLDVLFGKGHGIVVVGCVDLEVRRRVLSSRSGSIFVAAAITLKGGYLAHLFSNEGFAVVPVIFG